MSECNNECDSCQEDCDHRGIVKLKKETDHANIKKVIAVVSGKGGVGKSLVTGMSAVQSSRAGKKTAILDADITGPSIPKMFGIHDKAQGNGEVIFPAQSATDIKIMSINLLTENENDPVLWRGPILANIVTQFYQDVLWEDVDYMFVDMPPGTGDVPLTVFQSLPIDGIIIVTSPQDLVKMIVEKAVKMANMMNIPIVGIVENMSYFVCPDCGKKHQIFGESHLDEICQAYNLRIIDRVPLDSQTAKLCDNGKIEFMNEDYLSNLMNILGENDNDDNRGKM